MLFGFAGQVEQFKYILSQLNFCKENFLQKIQFLQSCYWKEM